MTELAEILLERPPHPFWTVLRQLGIRNAVGVLPRYFADWREHAGELPWDYVPLALYRDEVEDAGLRLVAIEDNPPMDKLRLGAPGREEELEAVCALIRNMGRLGIPVWCYNWMAVLGWLRSAAAAARSCPPTITAAWPARRRRAPEPSRRSACGRRWAGSSNASARSPRRPA
jgi:mannonate dehydratase